MTPTKDHHPRTRILQNIARCNACGQTVESKHVHDYRECPCGNLAVDGGRQYLRRAIRSRSVGYTELTTTEPEPTLETEKSHD